MALMLAGFGTDHASIATEAKVVAKLKAEGIDKQSLTAMSFKTCVGMERKAWRNNLEQLKN